MNHSPGLIVNPTIAPIFRIKQLMYPFYRAIVAPFYPFRLMYGVIFICSVCFATKRIIMST